MRSVCVSLLAGAATVAAGAAIAADLPVRQIPPAPILVATVPVFTWTGFYFGVNAGYGFARRDSLSSFQSVPGSLTDSLTKYSGVVSAGRPDRDNDGFVGGGQVGYNQQIGNLVLGIEADIQYADLNKAGSRDVVTLTPDPGGFVGARNVNLGGVDYFGTVRGRLGFAVDRMLVYGTGGFAYGGADNDHRGVRSGYAVGGGVEYAFTANLSGKIEGLYVNLERDVSGRIIGTHFGERVDTTGLGRRNKDSDFAVVRAGLNYRFNTF